MTVSVAPLATTVALFAAAWYAVLGAFAGLSLRNLQVRRVSRRAVPVFMMLLVMACTSRALGCVLWTTTPGMEVQGLAQLITSRVSVSLSFATYAHCAAFFLQSQYPQGSKRQRMVWKFAHGSSAVFVCGVLILSVIANDVDAVPIWVADTPLMLMTLLSALGSVALVWGLMRLRRVWLQQMSKSVPADSRSMKLVVHGMLAFAVLCSVLFVSRLVLSLMDLIEESTHVFGGMTRHRDTLAPICGPNGVWCVLFGIWLPDLVPFSVLYFSLRALMQPPSIQRSPEEVMSPSATYSSMASPWAAPATPHGQASITVPLLGDSWTGPGITRRSSVTFRGVQRDASRVLTGLARHNSQRSTSSSGYGLSPGWAERSPARKQPLQAGIPEESSSSSAQPASSATPRAAGSSPPLPDRMAARDLPSVLQVCVNVRLAWADLPHGLRAVMASAEEVGPDGCHDASTGAFLRTEAVKLPLRGYSLHKSPAMRGRVRSVSASSRGARGHSSTGDEAHSLPSEDVLGAVLPAALAELDAAVLSGAAAGVSARSLPTVPSEVQLATDTSDEEHRVGAGLAAAHASQHSAVLGEPAPGASEDIDTMAEQRLPLRLLGADEMAVGVTDTTPVEAEMYRPPNSLALNTGIELYQSAMSLDSPVRTTPSPEALASFKMMFRLEQPVLHGPGTDESDALVVGGHTVSNKQYLVRLYASSRTLVLETASPEQLHKAASASRDGALPTSEISPLLGPSSPSHGPATAPAVASATTSSSLVCIGTASICLRDLLCVPAPSITVHMHAQATGLPTAALLLAVRSVKHGFVERLDRPPASLMARPWGKDNKFSPRTTRWYSFVNSQQREVLVEEDLRESEYTWEVPAQLLDLYLDAHRAQLARVELKLEDHQGTSARARLSSAQSSTDSAAARASVRGLSGLFHGVADALGEAVTLAQVATDDAAYGTWLQARATRLRSHIRALHTAVESYGKAGLGPDGARFKRSTAKADKAVAWVPTNLHVQEMRVRYMCQVGDARGGATPHTVAVEHSVMPWPGAAGWESADIPLQGEGLGKVATGDKREYVYDIVTVGAFAAHAFGMSAGLEELLQKRDATAQRCITRAAELRRDSLKGYIGAITPAQRGELSTLQRKAADAALEYQLRGEVVLCQALTALVSSFARKVRLAQRYMSAAASRRLLRQYYQCGYLFAVQSLLSTSGSESHMLSDFHSGVRALANVRIVLVPPAEDGSTRGGAVQLSLSADGVVTVRMRLWPPRDDCCLQDSIPAELLTGEPVRIVPVMVTQGVNERQTLANLAGSAGMQHRINRENFLDMVQYFKSWLLLYQSDTDDLEAVAARMQAGPDRGKLNWEIARRKEKAEVLRKFMARAQRHTVDDSARPSKNLNLLDVMADIARQVHGGRVTACKSAKDRTSMSITLEQCRILCDLHDMPRQEEFDMCTVMRRHGVRRANTEKNVGKAKYAISGFQQLFLPDAYHPPAGTGSGAVVT